MAHLELLIKPGWIVPVEPSGRVLENHALAIDGGRIVALPSAAEIDQFQARETIDLPGHALLPGLVNAHTHAAMSLLRGLADDLPLMQWLKEHIWPVEMELVGSEFVRDGTELAIAEMLKGGVTCFNDMYFFPDVVARTASHFGVRASVGLIVIGFPSPWAKNIDDYFRRAREVHDALRDSTLVQTAFAPHSPYMVDDGALERVRVLADELDIPVHMHVHETRSEVERSEADHGVRPIARLQRLGLLNAGLMAVHMTQLTESEIDTCAAAGVHVLHCPESNLKLAAGFCPVKQLQESGINVALGTDGAASNNDLDLFGEMKTAALLAKAIGDDAAALPASKALAMATINGAAALGLKDEIGSLSPGKSADCIAVEMDRIESLPMYDVISHLVYTASRNQVTDVWIRGERLVKDSRLTQMNEHDIRQKTQSWARRIAQAREAAA